MDAATEITEFGTGLRAHLGLHLGTEQVHDEIEPSPPAVEPASEEIDILALLEAELIERELTVAAKEAALASRSGYTGIDELALARERRATRP